MRNLIRFYNQNRKSIWIFVIIIFFLFLILKLVDAFLSEDLNEESINTTNTQSINENSQSNVIISSNKSAISGENISTNNLNKAQEDYTKQEQLLEERLIVSYESGETSYSCRTGNVYFSGERL